MILLIHITIAVTSILFSFVTYFVPSKSRIQIGYAFIAATLASGFYLVWQTKPTHMASICITGLTYLGLTLVAIQAARRKLA